jgi:hypothetical protein
MTTQTFQPLALNSAAVNNNIVLPPAPTTNWSSVTGKAFQPSPNLEWSSRPQYTMVGQWAPRETDLLETYYAFPGSDGMQPAQIHGVKFWAGKSRALYDAWKPMLFNMDVSPVSLRAFNGLFYQIEDKKKHLEANRRYPSMGDAAHALSQLATEFKIPVTHSDLLDILKKKGCDVNAKCTPLHGRAHWDDVQRAKAAAAGGSGGAGGAGGAGASTNKGKAAASRTVTPVPDDLVVDLFELRNRLGDMGEEFTMDRRNELCKTFDATDFLKPAERSVPKKSDSVKLSGGSHLPAGLKIRMSSEDIDTIILPWIFEHMTTISSLRGIMPVGFTVTRPSDASMQEWRWMLVKWLRVWIHTLLHSEPTKVGDEADIDFSDLLRNMAHAAEDDEKDEVEEAYTEAARDDEDGEGVTNSERKKRARGAKRPAPATPKSSAKKKAKPDE